MPVDKTAKLFTEADLLIECYNFLVRWLEHHKQYVRENYPTGDSRSFPDVAGVHHCPIIDCAKCERDDAIFEIRHGKPNPEGPFEHPVWKRWTTD